MHLLSSSFNRGQKSIRKLSQRSIWVLGSNCRLFKGTLYDEADVDHAFLVSVLRIKMLKRTIGGYAQVMFLTHIREKELEEEYLNCDWKKSKKEEVKRLDLV